MFYGYISKSTPKNFTTFAINPDLIFQLFSYNYEYSIKSLFYIFDLVDVVNNGGGGRVCRFLLMGHA